MSCRTVLLLCLATGVAVCGAAKAGDAEKGKSLFSQQCVTCHNANNTEKKLGPGLKGVFKLTKLVNGKKATEQNIRDQIDNGGNGMPSYRDALSDHDKDNLIAYLKTL